MNDPTTFPPSSRSHGSHHWAFERLLSASLVPLTAAAFVTSGSNYPVLDALFGVGIVMHSHIGVCFFSLQPTLKRGWWAKFELQVRLYSRRLPTHPQIPCYWSDCKMGFENRHCCYTSWNLSVQYERYRYVLTFLIVFLLAWTHKSMLQVLLSSLPKPGLRRSSLPFRTVMFKNKFPSRPDFKCVIVYWKLATYHWRTTLFDVGLACTEIFCF